MKQDAMKSGNLIPSVCFDAVFEGSAAEEALKIVAECGYTAFEFWCWWEKELEQIVELRDQYGMQISAFCTKFISLVDASKRDEYLKGLEESIAVAQRLECTTLISQVGDFVHGKTREEQHQSLVDGLVEAAPMLESAGINLVIEPLNEKVDHAGYYLVRSDEAFEIVEKVDSANVKVVFDIYHQQISEGDLIKNITSNIDKIGHFHAAGNPGRNELSSGEINYPQVFSAIESTEYQGFVGLEYWPKQNPKQGLEEVAKLFS
jgi:hydroxypyruvate isomerase